MNKEKKLLVYAFILDVSEWRAYQNYRENMYIIREALKKKKKKVGNFP